MSCENVFSFHNEPKYMMVIFVYWHQNVDWVYVQCTSKCVHWNESIKYIFMSKKKKKLIDQYKCGQSISTLSISVMPINGLNFECLCLRVDMELDRSTKIESTLFPTIKIDPFTVVIRHSNKDSRNIVPATWAHLIVVNISITTFYYSHRFQNNFHSNYLHSSFVSYKKRSAIFWD